MPLKLKTRCRHPGCVTLTRSGWCDQHQRSASSRAADRQRGNSAQRGYDYRWRKLRDWYYRQHPLCEDCLDEQTLTPASLMIEVDHIIPLRIRPDLRLDSNNLRSLCRRHHKLKTDRDRQRSGSTRAANQSTLSNQSRGGDEVTRVPPVDPGGRSNVNTFGIRDHALPARMFPRNWGPGG